MRVKVSAAGLGLASLLLEVGELSIKATPFSITDEVGKIFSLVGQGVGAAIAAVQEGASKGATVMIEVLP